MNCSEYRDKIAADPSYGGDTAHLKECAECRAWRAEMRVLDDKIRRALLLDVPDLAMPELTDSRDVVPLLGRRRISPPAWLAIAATVAIAAIIGVRSMSGLDDRAIAAEVLAHIDNEPAALRVTDVAVGDDLLQLVVPPDVASIGQNTGLVSYARSCVVDGHVVPHLVIQGRRGPVTILLMPEEKVSGAIDLDGDNVRGVILPVGRGSIAIIGTAGEALEDIQQNVLQSVMWTS